MRNAIAGLRRQAALAALACAVAMGAVSVVSRSAPFHAPAVEAFDRPILVKTVALDRTPVASESKIKYPSAVQQVSAPPPAPAKATNPAVRHSCAVTPCQRLAAALAPAPPRRPAMRPAAPTLEAALATPAHSEDKGARSLSDRLLWPVGAMRDRMVGLISSL